MPFKSKSQLRTCYGKRPKGWDCDAWLNETPSICSLPEKVGAGKIPKSRCMRKGERIVGDVQTGTRGGKYFVIKEKDKCGRVCTMKVYVPKTQK